MLEIIAQLNPAALAALILLLVLGFLGAIVLKLVKNGKATSPKDLVQVARDRSAAAKASKAAVKQAEAAIAEPIANSRLSRIGARLADEGESADASDQAVSATAEEADIDANDIDADDEAADRNDAPSPILEDPATTDEAELLSAETIASDRPTGIVAATPAALDLADPANHPQDWDGLVAVVDALEIALQRPWPEDRLLPVPRFEESAADPEGAARAASQRQSAIQLARTINGAAREQAQEVIAVVREFAHKAPFSPQDCAAVMGGLHAIEWMALIERDAQVEKRTLPLTRHDPEAPLWVHEAVTAIYSGAQRNAA